MAQDSGKLQSVSAQTARVQLGKILQRARDERERFVVDRNGEPAAVILSFEDYMDSIASAGELLRRFGEEAQRNGTALLSMDEIDAEIDAARRLKMSEAEKKPA